MKKGIITVIAVFTIALFVCTLLTPAFAGGAKKSFKKSSYDAGKATVNYPAYLVAETADVIGKAGRGFVNAIGGTVKYAGEVLVGKGKSASKAIRTPIEGTIKTVSDAVVGTASAPVRAGRRTKEQW